jgi:SpoVK/Ycf46/Vps4 family AAA+-type ATPase
MNRSFGISALFAGHSGTGKTMAAEVLGGALWLNLYRIDLSAVVKQILRRDGEKSAPSFRPEHSGATPFFGETDALFGKGSEVENSHDRYANSESNYLLQLIEAYRGLAILATNIKSALDSQFAI